MVWCQVKPYAWVEVAGGFVKDYVETWYRKERRRRTFESWKEFKLQAWERFIPKDEASKEKRGERRGFPQSIDAYISNLRNVITNLTNVNKSRLEETTRREEETVIEIKVNDTKIKVDHDIEFETKEVESKSKGEIEAKPKNEVEFKMGVEECWGKGPK